MSREARRADDAQLRRINRALALPAGRLRALRRLAVDGGLVNDSVRARVWPLLLGVEGREGLRVDVDHPPRCEAYQDQIQKDVDRSLFRFTENMTREARALKRRELDCLLNAVLIAHPELHYFQGFHDIASVFLLVTGPSVAFNLIEAVSLAHLRDCFDRTFDRIQALMSLIFPLVAYFDRPVFEFLRRSQVEPSFAISWIITWFSHHFDDYATVTRLYDIFLASHPMTCLYMSAATILLRRDELMREECSFASVHVFLRGLSQQFDMALVLQHAQDMMRRCPPAELIDFVRLFSLTSARSISLIDTSAVVRYPYRWMVAAGWEDPLLDPQPSKMRMMRRRLFKRRKVIFGVLGSLALAGLGIAAALIWRRWSRSSP